MENEIKLAFPSEETLNSVVEQPWFRDAITVISEKDEVYENRYLDTVERDFRRTMTSVRVRQVIGSDYIHTVKTGGSGMQNGLSVKYEWNLVTKNRDFDIDYFLSCVFSQEDPIEVLRDALVPYRGKQMIDLCRTHFRRKTIHAKYLQSEMEICLDVGACYGLANSMPIIEMEIELIEGRVDDITLLGDLVVSNTNATYQTISKLGRCMQLLEEVDHA